MENLTLNVPNSSLNIFLLMYPWCWEMLFEKLLLNPSLGQVAPSVCNELALQLRNIKEGGSDVPIP